MKIDELVAYYIDIRDRKAARKAEYEASIVKLDEALDKIEAKLLTHFNDTGSESVRTEFGTAYKAIHTTASVADRDAFMGFVLENNALELLETRCAKKAVEEFMTVNNEPPPGVNVTRVAKVNFRRSN